MHPSWLLPSEQCQIDIEGKALRPISWIRRFLRFGLIGLCVTVLHLVVATTLIFRFESVPALANAIAFGVATCFSYLLNTRWSFAALPAEKSLKRFVTVSSVGLILASTIASVAEAQGLDPWIGILCVVVTVPAMSFPLHALWTYR